MALRAGQISRMKSHSAANRIASLQSFGSQCGHAFGSQKIGQRLWRTPSLNGINFPLHVPIAKQAGGPT